MTERLHELPETEPKPRYYVEACKGGFRVADQRGRDGYTIVAAGYRDYTTAQADADTWNGSAVETETVMPVSTQPKPMTAREALAWALQGVWPDHGSDREIKVAAGLVEHFLREKGFAITAIPMPRSG